METMALTRPRIRPLPQVVLTLLGAAAVLSELPASAPLRQLIQRPGELFALIATFAFGPWAGLAVAIAGALPFGTRTGILFAGAEALAIGFAFRRWKSFAGAALAFWLPVGLPAVYFCPELARFPGIEPWLAAAAGFTSGVLTAAGAGFLTRIGRPRATAGPLRNSVLTAILMGCGVSTVLVTVTHNSMFRREAETEVGRQLQSQASLVGRSLDGYLQLHQASITSLAESLRQSGWPEPGPAAQLLATHQRAYRGFLTLLAADSDGLIVAAAPSARFDNRSSSVSIRDREYFRIPSSTGRNFLSGVFKGRGFGTDPIVALSAPIPGDNGKPVGVVEGSLNLRALAALEPPGDQSNSILLLILDPDRRVVYASESLALAPLADVSGSPLLAASTPARPGVFRYQTAAGEQWMGTRVRIPGSGWQVVLQRSFKGLDARIARQQAIALMLVGFVLLGALLLADLIGKRFASPLEGLARQVSLFEPEKEPDTVSVHGTASSEVTALILHWNRLAGRLHDTYEALRTQMAEIEAARQSARAADYAKTRFLATVSHELRTPLNGIIGMSELLLRADLHPAELEQAHTMRASANALLRIIDDILQMARLEEGTVEIRPTPFRLAQVPEDVQSLLGDAARDKGLDFRFTIAPGVPAWIEGDASRLRQVLACLAGNAIKFTRAGHVELTIEPGEDAGRLLFRIRDTGVGVPPDRQKSLFLPFSQADNTNTRQFGGTGLGLAISKRLVELMGGSIQLESEPGKGTTVTFSLAFGKAEPPDEPAASLELLQQQQEIRVLVAEDHSVNRLVAKRLLEKLGYRVDLAEDGLAAVEACRRQSYAAVLMDCQMPRMDGFAATARIREEHPEPHLPILAITANALPEDRKKCLDAGMDDFMAKPLELAAMSAMLKHWIPAEPPTRMAPTPRKAK